MNYADRLYFNGHALRYDDVWAIDLIIGVPNRDGWSDRLDSVSYGVRMASDGTIYVNYAECGWVNNWPYGADRVYQNYLIFPRSLADLKLIVDRGFHVKRDSDKSIFGEVYLGKYYRQSVFYSPLPLSKFGNLWTGGTGSRRLKDAKFDERGGLVMLKRSEFEPDLEQYAVYYYEDLGKLKDRLAKWKVEVAEMERKAKEEKESGAVA